MPNIFSLFGNHPPFTILDETEACASVLLACRHANEFEDRMIQEVFFAKISHRNMFFGKDMAALFERAEAYFIQAKSPKTLIDASLGAIRPELRVPLFYHCLDLALADGVVTPQEHTILQYLKEKLEVDDESMGTAIEVLVMMNRL